MSGKILALMLLAAVVCLAQDVVVVDEEGEEAVEVIEEEQHFEMKGDLMILSEKTTQDAIDEFPLILIKFYAPWCGHCKTLAPIYEQLAHTMTLAEEQVQVASIDCTVHATVCQKHGVRGYPTLKYFIDGEPHQYAGKRAHEELVEWLNSKAFEVRGQREAEEM